MIAIFVVITYYKDLSLKEMRTSDKWSLFGSVLKDVVSDLILR